MPSYKPTTGTLARSKWALDSHLIPHPSHFPCYYPKIGCTGVYPCNEIATEIPWHNLRGILSVSVLYFYFLQHWADKQGMPCKGGKGNMNLAIEHAKKSWPLSCRQWQALDEPLLSSASLGKGHWPQRVLLRKTSAALLFATPSLCSH